ncbi:zinc dependent phospholipase C family protein [Dethiothermospora halolimnae]|uniref:zinc dependent phospholipase C family protein n=1 Tax=Dethiothermospora halolimnae TaxID=3114390 RepID=UPI003CCBA123
MKGFERYYGNVFRGALKVINPFKKRLIKTECKVHIFINNNSLRLLKEHGYDYEHMFYRNHIKELNKGVVWADQDFKSINHFYSPKKTKGLYGHSNAKILTYNYYEKAIGYYKRGNIKLSIFYLGACAHIIQDMTVPQHVNIRLLDSHRQYENFVKITYDIVEEFTSRDKPIVFNELNHYLRFNAKNAIKIYKESRNLKSNKAKYHNVTKCILPLAQRTTAGLLVMFLKDVKFKS